MITFYLLKLTVKANVIFYILYNLSVVNNYWANIAGFISIMGISWFDFSWLYHYLSRFYPSSIGKKLGSYLIDTYRDEDGNKMVMGPSNNNSPTSKSLKDFKLPTTFNMMKDNPGGSQGGLEGTGEGSSRSQEAVGQWGSGGNAQGGPGGNTQGGTGGPRPGLMYDPIRDRYNNVGPINNNSGNSQGAAAPPSGPVSANPPLTLGILYEWETPQVPPSQGGSHPEGNNP